MDHDVDTHSDLSATVQEAAELRAKAVEQLESARDLAKRVRAEAMHELEDARERVARIAAREEEMAERWAALIEAERGIAVSPDTMMVAAGAVPAEPATAITEAMTEARAIIARAREEAGQIREQAMHLLAIAEGEKAESHRIAQLATERAAAEAERLRAEADAELQRIREDAEAADAPSDDVGIYSKRRNRKLPRIGESANSVLSEMSGLRARFTEEADRQIS